MTDESTQMTRRINKNRAGIVVGLLIGLWHLTWSLLVAFGVAQAVINWIFRLHFIQPPYTITAFNVVTAVTLIVGTSVTGFVMGWLFGAIWNWLHSKERPCKYAKALQSVVDWRELRNNPSWSLNIVESAKDKIAPNQDDDFTVRNLTNVAEAASEPSKVMTDLLASIAAVSLLVGGIGIMNIMLVSVTERTREIGIRMASGASSGVIRRQFLIESITLSLVGGAIGVLLGVGASVAISHTLQWPTLISPLSVSVAVLFSALVGVAFGYYPAHKAASLDPIEALRYE